MTVALLILAGTYLVMALGRLPASRLDRTGAALLGASLMVATGTLSLDEAYRAIDLDTITLLLGMMIVVANLRLAGFFGLAALWVGRHAHRPVVLLVGVTAVSALLSAFLVNDAVCLMLTPFVIEITRAMRRNPVPYVIAVATASNIGSVATITGNPQNMVIGTMSRIPYGAFTAALAPVAVLGVVVAVGAIVLAHRDEFLVAAPPRHGEAKLRARWNGPLLAKSLAAIVGAIVLFFLGVAPPKVAIVAGALLLVTRRIRPERVMREIDWPLLLLFAGLFIVVGGAEKAVLTPEMHRAVGGLALGQPAILATVAAVLSNLVSNVPAVLVLKPFVGDLADPRKAWLVLAMAATLAGNFTILGSIANLIVVQRARATGVTVGFWPYFRVGAPVTVITIALGLWLLR
ncbi:MAG: anion transporter [Alphaproteobacteria bacterium]|nr:anion transporter [Alphaproteobacteria bacterium]